MKQSPSTPTAACLLACLLVACCGCSSLSNWSDASLADDAEMVSSASASHSTPLAKLTRHIELESRFVQIQFDPKKPDQLQSMWQWCDETVLPAHTRTLLAKNGLRVGRVVQPGRLESRLKSLQADKPADVVDQFLASADISSRQSEGSRIDPLRIGKRTELPVRAPTSGEEVVLVIEDDELIGQTLNDSQFLFAITPEMGRSAASVRLAMRPEIQYGEMRQDWVQGDGALRIDSRRSSWSLASLQFELEGGEGDLFVIAETALRQGVGKKMLGDQDVNQMEQQTVLLLRIAAIPTPSQKL